MAGPGRSWNPPPRSGLGLGLPAPVPPPPPWEIERITGRTHLSLYNEREAEFEYDAFLHGENYIYRTPETDAEGYLVDSVTG